MAWEADWNFYLAWYIPPGTKGFPMDEVDNMDYVDVKARTSSRLLCGKG